MRKVSDFLYDMFGVLLIVAVCSVAVIVPITVTLLCVRLIFMIFGVSV